MFKENTKWFSVLLVICTLLGGLGGYGYGFIFNPKAPVTNFLMDINGNLDVNSIETNTARIDALTSDRIPIAGVNGLLGDSSNLRWTNGSTLNAPIINATLSLYVNGEKYYPESEASYVVWVDGATYYAKNGHTGAVTSNATLSTLLTSITTGFKGVICFKPNLTYTQTAQVLIPAGVMLEFQGATLNIAALNTTALVFNNGGAIVNQELTGIRDAVIIGDITKSGTWVSSAENVVRGLIYENIHLQNCNNGFKVIGAGYSNLIDHCTSIFGGASPLLGTFIEVQGNTSSVYAAHAMIIRNNEISADAPLTGTSYGIKVMGIAGDYNPAALVITGNWIERVNICIYTDGTAGKISDNYFLPVDTGVILGQYAYDTHIDNNVFDLACIDIPTGNFTQSTGVLITATGLYNIINGNKFGYSYGRCIDTTNTPNLLVNSNVFTLSTGASGIYGNLGFSTYSNNQFFGFVGAGIAFNLTSGSGNNAKIVGNTFKDIPVVITCPITVENVLINNNNFKVCTTAIDVPRLNLCSIQDNTFSDVGTVMSALTWYPLSNIIRNNIGYVTENSGTATLLNGQNHVHVTHGLSYTPTAADITITFTEAPTNATTYWYVGGLSSTEFQLFANDPGASNLDFSWSAHKTP